jgi:long-subunit fatty acid transport protein
MRLNEVHREIRMNKTFVAAATLASIGATSAVAGGIERTNQTVGILFQEGRYVELSFGFVDPDVSGVATSASPTPGASSGDMTDSYYLFGAAYRADINDRLSYAIIFDQPFGAATDYPAGTGYFAQGATANLDTNAVSALLKYTTPENFSVYGGLRYQTLGADAFIPYITAPAGPTAGVPYQVDGSRDGGVGYIIGAAYERPEIALRVALTYNSAIDHDLATTESSFLGNGVSSTTPVETPQSVNLDFQTGIAADTLLFGGIRWVDWTEFNITPQVYDSIIGRPLVSYSSDTTTYVIGLGRKLNETWSVSGRISYEDPTGGFSSNLGPTDGYLGGAIGVQYTQGPIQVSGGISYIDIGDAETQLLAPVAASNFSGNSAYGLGLRVGYTF